ncbi:MAG: hypothetical protein LBC97_16750 [Bifidobacteriaceae bacterium]|nr:hypothetical protein [Bifidobacteriaceae bacterium]
MPIAPPPADGAPNDELLVAADLPPGWRLPNHRPGERPDAASAAIDRALSYDDWAATDGERRSQAESDQNETVDGRWLLIEHEATHARVLIRLQRQTHAVPEEVRITGVVHLPWRPGDPVTSQLLRQLPTARIEAAINKRLFAMKRETGARGGRVVLPSGRKVRERDLLKPLGDPKRDPDFYELAALQHGRLAAQGDSNPTATMARISGVAQSTAQGWVAKARTRGLLPPGRRGRAG